MFFIIVHVYYSFMSLSYLYVADHCGDNHSIKCLYYSFLLLLFIFVFNIVHCYSIF